MGLDSKIEWTDHTINLWWGCSKVHTGCKNCYAEHLSDVRYKGNLWGKNSPRRIVKGAFNKLRQIQQIGEETGNRQKVFVGSMMDIFELSKPVINSNGEPVYEYTGIVDRLTTGMLRTELFSRIMEGEYDLIDFQLLTKRPENVYKMVPETMWNNPPSNVMIGASVSNQETYHQMMAGLALVPFKTFLSIEPMTGSVHIDTECNVDWIICGGESGPKKRPFNLDWAYALKDECRVYGIPFFFKQIDKVRDKEDGIPEDLLIREFPNVNIRKQK